jgi:chemotaxis regulatin CheY-phosphate phosphatase CheZ
MSPRAFDELDDHGTEPTRAGERRASGQAQYRVPETESILRRVIEIIDTSPGMPMSASVRVNKEEVLEMLDDAVSRLPDELRSARWLLKEREEFIARSRRDGDELIADAKSRVAHMVQRTEVAKAAELRAAQIVEEAEATSRRMRRETEDYCDQKLASFENVLARIQKAVAAGRDRLSAPTIEEAELGARHAAERGEHVEREERPTGAVPVFDQDR